MGHVYTERAEIPIPAEAHINHNDARVYLMASEPPHKRTVIGKATSETTMHPNDMFRKLYPEIWGEVYAKYKDPIEYELCVGMYGLCLGASTANGEYALLQEAYGPKYANVIMDYAMYSMLERSSTTQLFPERMRKEVLFSNEVYSDSWLSRVFTYEMDNQMHMEFRELWIKRCIERGTSKVWLCIDGSNNDCQIEDSEYAEPGENKSHTHKTIVGFMYAVDAKSGEPVTYFVNPGGEVDAQAFQKLIHYLVGYGLEVEGVIMDRGFCTHEVIKTLKELELDYVIMMPKNTLGCKTLLEDQAETIFWNPEYLVNGKDLYGISQEAQIWATHPDTGVINLFFSAVNGCFRGGDFNREISDCLAEAQDSCAKGKKPSVLKKMSKIVIVEKDEAGKLHVVCDYEEWKKQLRQTGYFSILTSRDYGPREANAFYSLRIASEVQYRILKSEEGFDTTRVHTDPGMLTKYAICFATSILRHTIMTACQKEQLDTNEMIQQTDRIILLQLENLKYRYIRDMSLKARKLYGQFSMDMDSFDAIAQDYNHRKSNAVKSQVHTLPEPQKQTQQRRRGRQPGSKNKATLAREAERAAAIARGEVEEASHKRGRRIGSHDTKPRKKRSDAGVKRGKRIKPEIKEASQSTSSGPAGSPLTP